jgi:hypothetical protein
VNRIYLPFEFEKPFDEVDDFVFTHTFQPKILFASRSSLPSFGRLWLGYKNLWNALLRTVARPDLVFETKAHVVAKPARQEGAWLRLTAGTHDLVARPVRDMMGRLVDLTFDGRGDDVLALDLSIGGSCTLLPVPDPTSMGLYGSEGTYLREEQGFRPLRAQPILQAPNQVYLRVEARKTTVVRIHAVLDLDVPKTPTGDHLEMPTKTVRNRRHRRKTDAVTETPLPPSTFFDSTPGTAP